jgi:superfamily II DNA/RNA helicase
MHSIPTLLLLLILSETTFCMIRIQSTVRYFAFRFSKALFSTTTTEVATIQPWSELCKSNAIIEAIRSQGMHMPTDIQCKAYKHILAGGDAVIGAETGSGKTLSYTLPLVDKFLCNEKVNNLENLDVKNIMKYVILSPNQDLCNQIHRMITFLADYINKNTEFQVSVGQIC